MRNVAIALVLGLTVGFGVALLLRNGGDAPAQATPLDAVAEAPDADLQAELPPIDRGIAPQDATDAETALRGFLAAEASGDWEASYAFLADEAREVAFPSAARWVNEHASFPSVVGYRVDGVTVDAAAGTASAETLTAFDPVVDPVLGLVAGRGHTTWQLELSEGGLWRVDPNGTRNSPLYPSDEGVLPALTQWVEDTSGCGGTAGLVGSPALADQLCTEEQPATVPLGGVGPLTDSDAVAPLLTEFGPEVFTWARTVEVDATTPFTAVLGPVGTDWRVLGVLQADA